MLFAFPDRGNSERHATTERCVDSSETQVGSDRTRSIAAALSVSVWPAGHTGATSGTNNPQESSNLNHVDKGVFCLICLPTW